jgi:hypothetical protein
VNKHLRTNQKTIIPPAWRVVAGLISCYGTTLRIVTSDLKFD